MSGFSAQYPRISLSVDIRPVNTPFRALATRPPPVYTSRMALPTEITQLIVQALDGNPAVADTDPWTDEHVGFLLIHVDNSCWMIDISPAGELADDWQDGHD